MHLDHFKQVLAIRDWGTISAAADELAMTQPALSRSIKKLEQELGCQLFKRSKNRVEFKEAGFLFLETAEKILAEAEALHQKLEALNRKHRTLKVSSVAPAPNWKLTEHLVSLKKGLIIEPELVKESVAVKDLSLAKAEYAITTHPIHLPEILSKPFMSENLYANLPISHPLAQEKSLTFKQLDGETFLVLADIGIWEDTYRQGFRESQFIIQKDLTVFNQLLNSSDLLGFTTNLAVSNNPRRVSIPFADSAAKKTFFLSIRADAGKAITEIFHTVNQEN